MLGKTTLEDHLYTFLKEQPDIAAANPVLQYGFINIASYDVLSRKQTKQLERNFPRQPKFHDIVGCVKAAFKHCEGFKEFVDARNNMSCTHCKYQRLLEHTTSAVIHLCVPLQPQPRYMNICTNNNTVSCT